MDTFRKGADLELTIDKVKHPPCTIGIDLAALHYAFVTTYFHEAGINISNWAADGKLISTPGSSMDFNLLFKDIEADHFGDLPGHGGAFDLALRP